MYVFDTNARTLYINGRQYEPTSRPIVKKNYGSKESRPTNKANIPLYRKTFSLFRGDLFCKQLHHLPIALRLPQFDRIAPYHAQENKGYRIFPWPPSKQGAFRIRSRHNAGRTLALLTQHSQAQAGCLDRPAHIPKKSSVFVVKRASKIAKNEGCSPLALK